MPQVVVRGVGSPARARALSRHPSHGGARPSSIGSRLMALQRTAGNSAVCSMLAAVQRDEDEYDEESASGGETQAATEEAAPEEAAQESTEAPEEIAEEPTSAGTESSEAEGGEESAEAAGEAPEESAGGDEATAGGEEASSGEEAPAEEASGEGEVVTGDPETMTETTDVDTGDTGDDAGGDVNTIDVVEADCVEGVGHGGGKGVKLHGQTDAGYNHGAPIPAPFPSSVTVTTKMVGTTQVFSAKGSFDVTFTATPTVTLPPMPDGLTPCQQTAVQAFIDGPLTAHEGDHQNAFKTNYDGKYTVNVDVKNIQDTDEMRQRAMENPVQAEDVKRADTANKASAKLDPWNKTVPGLDCTEP